MSNRIKTLVIIGTAAVLVTSYAGGNKLQDTQTLSLDVDGIKQIRMDVGAGSLHVIGDSQLQTITVEAKIYQKKPNDDYQLELERKSSSKALLLVDVNNSSGLFNWGSDNRIDLTVHLPAGLNIDIDDGSGEISVIDINGDLTIDDGSGKINIDGIAGNVYIDDGSGSITANNLGGDINIEDGSGSIDVNNVAGAVVVDDGSGSIDINGAASFVLADDGSGSVDIDNVSGEVDLGR